MDVLVVIPAFNPGPALARVAAGAAEVVGRESVLVVDDGSTDGSADAVAAAGFKVLRHPENRGKGAALRTGFAAGLSGAWGVLVTLDADGQHDPAWIPRLLTAMAPDVDLVIGSRMADPGPMPLLRVLTNRFMSAVLSALAGQRIRDTQSGLRAIRRRVLADVPLTTDRFETESELLIRSGRRGFVIVEVAIPAVYGDERSRIRPFADTLRWLRMLGRSGAWR